MEKLCVFCGSSPGNDPVFQQAARELGHLMARNKIELVYGGGSIGLMGILADAVLDHGGKVTGVIPKFLYEKEVGHDGLTKLIIVETMHERKMTMASLADGFLALPGGIGTLEELFEIYTWNQLKLVNHPVALLNVGGYYDHLIEFMEKMQHEGFVREATHKMLLKIDRVEETIGTMKKYRDGGNLDLAVV